MRSVHVQNELADGFEAGPLPPMAPDGSPRLEPVREYPPEPPRLCEAGPCRHYHRFQVQLDAQNPMDERKPDGTVVRYGRVFHVQTHHYCYPDVGIELELGALPLLECNRWVPATSLLRGKRGIRRRFDRAVADWKAEQDRERDEIVEIVESEAASDRPEGTVQFHVAIVEPFGEGQAVGSAVVDAYATTQIWAVVGDALDDLANRGFTIGTRSPDAVDVSDPDGPITNLHATAEQLGYEGVVPLRVTIKKESP